MPATVESLKKTIRMETAQKNKTLYFDNCLDVLLKTY